MSRPIVNGLLNYHIKGDDALLYLGKDRYQRAGMGVEIHPGTPEHLGQILKFTPDTGRSTAHLPYSVVLDHDDTDRVRDFVLTGGSQIAGYVLHDTLFYVDNFAAGIELIKRLSGKLEGHSEGVVYIEYAACLPFELFYKLVEAVTGLPNIGICLDVGHIGINATMLELREINQNFADEDLKPGPAMTLERYNTIAGAAQRGREFAINYVESICKHEIPIHFHLHDGHPLSTFSPYGVCDHLPFFWEIPTLLPNIGAIGGLYGVSGLKRILEIALRRINVSKTSFTLEIHPQKGFKVLEDEYLNHFANWADLTNARAMNYWIDLVIQNGMIFNNLCTEILSAEVNS